METVCLVVLVPKSEKINSKHYVYNGCYLETNLKEILLENRQLCIKIAPYLH
jgi:hypothetical protein